METSRIEWESLSRGVGWPLRILEAEAKVRVVQSWALKLTQIKKNSPLNGRFYGESGDAKRQPVKRGVSERWDDALLGADAILGIVTFTDAKK